MGSAHPGAGRPLQTLGGGLDDLAQPAMGGEPARREPAVHEAGVAEVGGGLEMRQGHVRGGPGGADAVSALAGLARTLP